MNVPKTKIKGASKEDVDFLLISKVRAIFDAKYCELVYNGGEMTKSQDFIEFVHSWVSKYTIDPETRDVIQIDKNDITGNECIW